VREGNLEDRVLFTGRVDDLADHVRAADVFAFPSVFEAFGISLVEAAASGVPAVASRTGGIVDVVEEGRSGLLVTPGSEEELGSALQALVRSPQRRAEMGERARRVALRRFDERDAVARYAALFRETAGRGGGMRPAGAGITRPSRRRPGP
jgi:glycosyltransferase involved in cell wall biosynthesis